MLQAAGRAGARGLPGSAPEDILEAIEIALPEAGVVAFQHGLEAWADVFGVEGLTPSVPGPDAVG